MSNKLENWRYWVNKDTWFVMGQKGFDLLTKTNTKNFNKDGGRSQNVYLSESEANKQGHYRDGTAPAPKSTTKPTTKPEGE